MNTTTTFSLEAFCKATSDEWNYKRNHPLTPADVDINVESSKKVWWICHVCKIEWSTTVSDRINNYGYGCRECYKNQLTEHYRKVQVERTEEQIIQEIENVREHIEHNYYP